MSISHPRLADQMPQSAVLEPFLANTECQCDPDQPTSRSRQFLFPLLSVLLSIIVCVASAEMLLRFLPVQSGLRTMPVNADNPVFHFTPERDVTFSRGWNFDMVNHRRVNNAGWVNDQDYEHQSKTPRPSAIIGDSYIEAMMVPYVKPCMDTWQILLKVDCGSTASALRALR